MDGFETGDLNLWTVTSGATATTTSIPAGFSGTYYCELQSSSDYIEKQLSASKSELYIAYKLQVYLSTCVGLVAFKDSATTYVGSITRNTTTGFLEFRLGDYTASVQATGSIQLLVGKVYLIEIRYKPLNTGGICTVKVDGVQDINFSGDSTAGLENAQTIRFGGSNSNAIVDDIVVDDANWIGNTKIGIIVPNGTGTTNNWTASAGTAYQCVDEIPPVDTDYVYSNTVDQIATYAMGTISNMNTIKAVQLQARAAYEGSPTPLHIQLGVRAGADYFATDLSPGISFGMLTRILELNPADSAAWEQADIDGLEVGIKATA
jgi:hypothetical protein